MKIGILKEIKNSEMRVAATPAGVTQLVAAGHAVVVEKDAGVGAGFSDDLYEKAGATIADAKTAWNVDMVMKVKEPLESEYQYFRPGLILYTYLHLAPNRKLTEALLKAEVTGVAYETVEDESGHLPLLHPMSEIAGRMAVYAGIQFLQKQYGGKGLLLSGVPGVKRGNVVIIGGGVVGLNAAKMAIGLGANVTVLDISPEILAQFDDIFGSRVQTIYSTPQSIEAAVRTADLVIGAVLIKGATAPILVTKEMIQQMEPGSVVVDVPIDQGGIFETSTHATTLEDPTFVKYGVVHYTVANVPGSVARTSTDALTSVTLPLALKIANCGIGKLLDDLQVATGLNTYQGKLVNVAVAKSQNVSYTDLAELQNLIQVD